MPDYMFLLESRLNAEQRAALARVQELAQALEINVYLTGGAVRDLICGMPIRDLDFIVEGSPFRLAHDAVKHGARILEENEKLRHVEMLFPGEVDASIAGARSETYERPGTKPEIHWSTAMEDLRRRDLSINAIGISLNPASRGLLLDPTNGLSDLEQNHEVRALSIHSFTNQPVRLLRVIRYGVRMGFKMEQRTAEWFALAIERGLHEQISSEDVGGEVRQLAKEEKATAILKAWEDRELIAAIHPQLKRRHPDYDGLNAFARVRENLLGVGLRIPTSGAFAPVAHYLLGRLKSREAGSAISKMEFLKAEAEAVAHLETEAEKVVKLLKGPARNLYPKGHDKKVKGKVAEARATYDFLEKQPVGLLAFIVAEYSQPKALSTIRTFLFKWKQLRPELPVAELEVLGIARGPKFEKILEDLFNLQLTGKAKNPQDRTKLLRKLAGIKPEKKKEEPKKEEKKDKAGKEKKGAAAEKAAPVAPKGPQGKAAPAVTAPAAKPAGKPLAKSKAPAKKAKPRKTAKHAKKAKRAAPKRAAKKKKRR